MANSNKVKVGNKTKVIPFKDREAVELVLGRTYYVSFGEHIAQSCILRKILETSEGKKVSIDVQVKPRSKKGFVDLDGSISHNWVSTHCIFADEIGNTPEQAVQHEVTW